MSGVWPAWTCLVSNDHRGERGWSERPSDGAGSSIWFWLLMACSPGVMGLLGSGRRTQRRLRTPDLRLSSLGARHNGPALAGSRSGLLNLVITRGTPPRLEGCRPASRGLTLALMTETKRIARR